MAVSVVIPNRNGKKLLKKNLPHLIEAMNNSTIKYEIIVVDDASTDDSKKFVNSNFPFIVLVELPRNSGFAIAANNGVKKARYNYVLLLNSDIRVEREFILPLLKFFRNSKTFAVSNRAMKDTSIALTKPHQWIFKYGFFKEVYAKEDQKAVYAFGASGGHSLFDKKKFLELGGFDELFSPFYYEDADLGYRAWKRGYCVYYEPNSVVYHEHQANIGSSFSTNYINFIVKRNMLLFMWKNLSDISFLISHIIFLPSHILLATFKNPICLIAFIAAIAKLPKIIKIRMKENQFTSKSDKDLQQIFTDQLNSAVNMPPV